MGYISRDITLTVSGNTARTSDMIYIFRGDKNILLNIKIMDVPFKYQEPVNILSEFPNNCYAAVGIKKPNGEEIIRGRVPIIDNTIEFLIDETICDELTEVGTHQLQIKLYAEEGEMRSRLTIPIVVAFEVLNPGVNFEPAESLVGLVQVDLAVAYSDNIPVRTLNPDGSYNKTIWVKGDFITAEKLNKIEDAIYDLANTNIEQKNKLNDHETRIIKNTDDITIINDKNTQQDNRMDSLDTKINNNNEIITNRVATHEIDTLERDKVQDERLKNIESKNKTQDIMMSGLFNENEDGRLNTSEIGNNVTLTGSKKGLVDVTKIVGNTQVNCAKENKEIILNDKIDVTGYNNVVIDGTVDGGALDVIIEGNTIVNRAKENKTLVLNDKINASGVNSVTIEGTVQNGAVDVEITGESLVNIFPFTNEYNVSDWWNENSNSALNKFSVTAFNRFQIGKTYTMVLVNNPCITEVYISALDTLWSSVTNNIATITVGQNADLTNNTGRNFMFKLNRQMTNDELAKLKIMLLEGDYTNKPIPTEYFEGIQSSFETNLVDGKYEVPVKVTGKNILDITKSDYRYGVTISYKDSNTVRGTFDRAYGRIELSIPKEVVDANMGKYVLGSYRTFNVSNENARKSFELRIVKNDGSYQYIELLTTTNFKITNDIKNIDIRLFPNNTNAVLEGEFQFEDLQIEFKDDQTATTYEPYYESTGKVLLNSPPLKGDKVVYKDGKWLHWHSRVKEILDDTREWALSTNKTLDDGTTITIYNCLINNSLTTITNDNINLISTWGYNSWNYILFNKADKNVALLNNQEIRVQYNGTLDNFKQELQTNPISVIYELANPYYEEVEGTLSVKTAPTLSHISIDSNIPTEMEVKNTPISCLLAPSRDYTVNVSYTGTGVLNALVSGIEKLGDKSYSVQFTTPAELIDSELRLYGRGLAVKDIRVLEGLLTDEELPGYFEGMKSVGELEDNKIVTPFGKHKANYFKDSKVVQFQSNMTGSGTSTLMSDETDEYYRAIPDTGVRVSLYKHLQKTKDFKAGKVHNISIMVRVPKDTYVQLYENTNAYASNRVISVPANTWTIISTQPTELSTVDAIIIGLQDIDCYLDYKKVKLEPGDTVTEWMPSIEDVDYDTWSLGDKKETQLLEPLRGLPNGTRDKYVKRDGEWYVERNCGEGVLNGVNEKWGITTSDNTLYAAVVESNKFKTSKTTNNGMYNIVNDKLPNLRQADLLGAGIGISSRNGNEVLQGLYVRLSPNAIDSNIPANFEKYFAANPTRVTFQLETPTYEKITDPNILSYLERTHISVNSTIPAKVNVKNAGISSLIKPSTKYTLSVTSSGTGQLSEHNTVGTNQNKLVLTTPATLVDNEIRPYGEGLIISKPILLEGEVDDKLIPQHFTDLQSSFEDQLVTEGEFEGKYKVPVKVNGKNLINISTLTNNKTINEATGEVQIAKDYEPYYESRANAYLTSPPLKGDEIVYKDGKLWHWHKMKTYTFTNLNNFHIEGLLANNVLTMMNDELLHKANSSNIICDKLTEMRLYSTDVPRNNTISINVGTYNQIRFYNENCTTVDDYKAWITDLQPSIVYEIKEPYYEEIQTDKLFTEIPENATLTLESSIPVQSVEVSYTGGLPSVYKLEETNNTQDELIDVLLMATDEMYMMLEPLLASVPETVTIKGVSKMVELYVAMVQRGLKKIEDVPERYREEVRRILEEVEK